VKPLASLFPSKGHGIAICCDPLFNGRKEFNMGTLLEAAAVFLVGAFVVYALLPALGAICGFLLVGLVLWGIVILIIS
jgi:hypothetical protein